MFIKEDANVQEWRKMLKEQFGVEDKSKLDWVSQYASVHEIYESTLGYCGGNPIPATNGVGPMYATPLNTIGMGGITAPGELPVGGPNTNATAPSHFFNQRPGSGDIPQSTLPMSLNVALLTIGLELLPVIPAKTPWQMVSYMDFPYAGGKLNVTGNLTSLDGFGVGAENKPIYIKVISSKLDQLSAVAKAVKELGVGAEVEVKSETNGTFVGKFKGIGRNDGGILLETVSCLGTDDSTPVAITTIFKDNDVTVAGETLEGAAADFVQTSADFIDGFANFVDGAKRSMTRAENETGTGNTIGLRLFTKWIQVGSYEVTGTVTRQQLQDLPLYGIDATGKIMEALQNEITQHINARILERVFALGVTNAAQQRAFQNVDLNLYLGAAGKADKDLADFGIDNYVDIYGNDHMAGGNWMVKNSEVLTSAENTATRQRRISSRILAAANLIQTVGRRGRPTWIVTNAKVASALEDCSGYVVNPMVNNLAQDGSKNLYLNGTLAGLKVYVDPYMAWDDCRICVGRKGDGNSPGAIFMPYILADTVSITAEGTMAPKMLVNSRYALETIGFYPHLQYYTFAVNSDFDII